jgi:predicted nucleic acid-binding protein
MLKELQIGKPEYNMVLAYIDTNVFLDFYQKSADRMTVFEEILVRGSNILLTQQTIEEFRRNRVACLTRLSENIEKGPHSQMHATAVVQALPGFKEWVKARDAAKKAVMEIAKELNRWLSDEQSDPVLVAFEKLVTVASTIVTDGVIIDRAKTRKLLGQPPTSPDKHTIGDELNWECMPYETSRSPATAG